MSKANKKSLNTTARIVGVLFIIGTVAGILSGVVTGPVLDASDYLAQVDANEGSVILGALLVLVMGFPLAMIPAMMFPIFRKYNEPLALGAVIFRGGGSSSRSSNPSPASTPGCGKDPAWSESVDQWCFWRAGDICSANCQVVER